MKQTIETKLGVVIILIVAVTVGAFVWKWEKENDWRTSQQSTIALPSRIQKNKPSTMQSPPIEITNQIENKKIEDVIFCKKIYKIDQTMLNNTDVAKRIAQIATQNPKNKICENIITNTNSSDENLIVNLEKQKNTDADYKDGVYFVGISVLMFKIDKNNIYALGAFAGEPTLIGTLK